MLKRAIRTCWIALDELDLLWIPMERDWRLNERHYGALQGLNKAETAAKHGEAQIEDLAAQLRHPAAAARRRRPAPPVARSALRGPRRRTSCPATESLKDTVARFLPYWHETIAPAIRSGRRVLITAHGNSLRALVKYLDGISDEDIVELNIPTGIPLVYELDAELAPIRHYYLGDPEAAQARRPRRVGETGSKRR